jgi:hypothetical protein
MGSHFKNFYTQGPDTILVGNLYYWELKKVFNTVYGEMTWSYKI